MSQLNVTTLKHESAGVDNITLASNGSVGFGTNSPLNRLTTRATANTYAGGNLSLESVGGANATYFAQTTPGDFYISNGGGADHIKLDSAGRVTMPYQPAFKAGRTTGHVSATTTVVFPSVIFNTGNHYNSSNGAFTTPIAGRYLFTTGLFSVSGTSVYTEIRVNGSHVAWTIYTGSGYGTANHSVILNLSANDIVTVVVSGGQLYAAGSTSDCYFSGILLG